MPRTPRSNPQLADQAGRTLAHFRQAWEAVLPGLDTSGIPLFGLFSFTAHLSEHVRRKGLLPFEISVQDATTLGMLRTAPADVPTYPSDLVTFPFQTATAMTRTLDRLERRGLLTRTPDADDRRRVRIRLTEDGRALADEIATVEFAFMRDVFTAFSPDERDQFTASLRRFIDGLAAQDGPS